VSPIDSMWSPKDGPTILLWECDDEGCPKLLNGIPKPVPFCPIWGNDTSKLMEKDFFFNNGTLKYLELWKLNILKDETYARAMKCYIEYWEVF